MFQQLTQTAFNRLLTFAPSRDRLWLRMVAPQMVSRDQLDRTLPLTTRLKAFSQGFFPAHFVAYGLDCGSNDSADYLSDRRWAATTLHCNGCAEHYLSDKLAWCQLLEALRPNSQPLLYGVIIEGQYVPWRGGPFAAMVREVPGLAIRPVHGSHGRGVSIVQRIGNDLALNGQPTNVAEILEHVHRMPDAIVTARVEQHPYAEAIYAGSTNTLRVLALRDPSTREPFIAGAVQRIGTRRSGHLDNWSQGGINASVEMESGLLSLAVEYPYTGRPTWHAQHPDTKAQIEGVTVPSWHETQSLVLELMNALPALCNVGWDIVITMDGPMVIEGNAGPGVTTLQMHRGLMRDPRCKRFYDAQG